MNQREKAYWEGIGRAQREPFRSSPWNLKQALEFLDDAYLFVKKAKGRVSESEPTELELYKKWMSLAKR